MNSSELSSGLQISPLQSFPLSFSNLPYLVTHPPPHPYSHPTPPPHTHTHTSPFSLATPFPSPKTTEDSAIGHVVSTPLLGSVFPLRHDKVCPFSTRRLSSTHWFRLPTPTWSVLFRHVVSPPLIGSVLLSRHGLSFFDTSSLLHSLDPSCHHDKVCHFPPRQKRC